MSDAKTEEFCRLYGEDRLQQIVEESFGDKPSPGLTFSHIEHHDAINRTIKGYFDHEGEEVCFDVDDGNWNGTVVREFGEDTNLDPPTGHYARLFDMRPQDQWAALPLRTALIDLYRSWCKGEVGDFKKTEEAYAYDAHFAPGIKTTNHYSAYASKVGVVIAGEWVEDGHRVTGKEVHVAGSKRVLSGPKRDTPEAALAQAAYLDLLALWFEDQGRSTAGGNARRAAEEWRTWATLFAAGKSADVILNEQKNAIDGAMAQFVDLLSL
jgi:hypothetical protein